jgi:hypothetical protein
MLTLTRIGVPCGGPRGTKWQGARRRRIEESGQAGNMVTYFVQSGADDGPVKIGKTLFGLIFNRIGQLQNANPERLRLIRLIDGPEEPLQCRFGHLWLHHEWFAFDPAMLGEVGFPENPSFDEVAAIVAAVTSPLPRWRNHYVPHIRPLSPAAATG